MRGVGIRAAVVLSLAAGMFATVSTPGWAQLSAVGPKTLPAKVSDVAYDRARDVYLAVGSTTSDLRGVFLSPAGDPVSSPFIIDSAQAYLARVAYSEDLDSGSGGFIIVWNSQNRSANLYAQLVRYPGQLLGSRVTIVSGEDWVKGDVAYSPADRVFLVGLGSLHWSSGRILRLDLAAQPLGSVAPLHTAPISDGCYFAEFFLNCLEVSVTWNPIAREFGVLYNKDFRKEFARVRGDGTIVSQTPLGIRYDSGALAANGVTGNYVAVGGGEVVEIDSSGNLIGRSGLPLTVDFYNGFSMRMAYSPMTGTFLFVSSASPCCGQTVALELNQHGVPLSSTILSGIWFDPRVASRTVSPDWLVAGGVFPSIGTEFLISSAPRSGGSDARLAGCLINDPFVAIGGGICLNGGWQPKSLFSNGGCRLPDPFASIGGGTCVNGGWLPPSILSPTPTPTPTPNPTGCTSPSPGENWVCLNGGWLPPGHPLLSGSPSPAPPPSSSCTIPDPFVSIGGGVCINGGWIPREFRIGNLELGIQFLIPNS